jgi:hypothetical protein
MLLGTDLDIILAAEPVLSEEALRDGDADHQGHEGELTAAYRLLDRLHNTYGRFIEIVITDALYANGPWMTRLDQYGYGGIISLQKENNEPLKEAIDLCRRGECQRQKHEDPDNRERVDFSDVDDIQTLSTYAGKVRVIQAEITRFSPPASDSSKPSKPSKPSKSSKSSKPPITSTWWFALTGCARRLSQPTALKAMRSRWHMGVRSALQTLCCRSPSRHRHVPLVGASHAVNSSRDELSCVAGVSPDVRRWRFVGESRTPPSTSGEVTGTSSMSIVTPQPPCTHCS